jgi:hypothetical protein
MLAQDLLNLRTQLRDAGIIFTYCGYVTEQVLAGVGDALSDVERLRALLEQIRNADREELKAMYKETLKGEVPEGSKGAGVGFIEIARRSSRPIQFDFTDVDGHFSFFALETEI